MEYLNAIGSVRFAAIEIDHFYDEGKEIFVPRAIRTKASSRGRWGSGSPVSKTNEEEFLNKVGSSREIFERILAHLKAYGDNKTLIYWGQSGFSFRVMTNKGTQSILWGIPNYYKEGKTVLQMNRDHEKQEVEIQQIFNQFQQDLSFLENHLHKTASYTQVEIGSDLKLDYLDLFLKAVDNTVERLLRIT